tara:strand:- start:18 stop:425 length:408 start_codon:yes stop_codon:yes gene_type:complete
MDIIVSINDTITQEELVALYKANKWSSAEQPELLFKAINNSHHFVTARLNNKLVGIGNAISDGYLVVYFPHLLVHPEFQGKGIGRIIMEKFQERYAGFHMQMLTADIDAVPFYNKLGFEKAGNTEPMWIYNGNEH